MNTTRTRIPDWLAWLMLGWFLALIVYSALSAQGTIKPPEWTAPVPPIITIVLVTAGSTERQQAIAALITETVITNAVDFGGGDVAAVYAGTIGYQIIDALRDAGLAITRRR